jgi:quercetin dioxygenase-like cupin family protein
MTMMEIINRRDLMNRMPTRHFLNLQRARFHQLAICVGGRGTHPVDSVPFDLSPGIALHIRPGQVQKFESPDSDALMVIWPVDFDPHTGATQSRISGSLGDLT